MITENSTISEQVKIYYYFSDLLTIEIEPRFNSYYIGTVDQNTNGRLLTRVLLKYKF